MKAAELKKLGLKWSTCAGCGAAIVWARNIETGNRIPLDVRAGVYQVASRGNEQICRSATHEATLEKIGHTAMLVSHFVTCPKRDQFRRQPEPPEDTTTAAEPA
jgi:hypothetical protein